MSEEKKRGRVFLNGLPFGDAKRDVRDELGNVAGVGEEPDGLLVDSRHGLGDFSVGDRILIWWWDLWWNGKVHRIAKRAGALTVRWDWSGNVTNGYEPRLVHKLPLRARL